VLQPHIDTNMLLTLFDEFKDIPAWKITLAPELSGAIEFIETLNKSTRYQHVSIFIGHSNASRDILEKALDKGAIGFTHLGNANCETAQRNTQALRYSDLTSDVVQFVLHDSKRLHPFFFELITDSYHLSDAFVKFAIDGRTHQALLITDGLPPTGLKDGNYHLGTCKIEKKGNLFYLANTKTLAGSGCHFADIVKNYSRITQLEGEPLWESLYHATVINPRKSLRLDNTHFNDEKNFVLIDKRGELMVSVTNGQTIYHHQSFKEWLLGNG
jgi:N-acetylglucosamine-6-phosphate deacetylase